MGVKVKDLTRLINYHDIQLIAGKKGIKNEVEWVHMVENKEISTFLRGGEIAFITGVGLNEETLEDLIYSIYKQNASAVIVNIGPYIPEVPKEVIQFADEHDFPLYVVPWRVYMADIIKTFCSEITRFEQKELELTAAFTNALIVPEMDSVYVPVLMKKGYLSSWHYIVTIVDICDHLPDGINNPIDSTRLNRFRKVLERSLKEEKSEIVSFVYNNKIIMIFPDMSYQTVKQLVNQYIHAWDMQLKEHEKYYVALGELSNGIRRISDSYKTADKIIELLKYDHRMNEIVSYEDSHLYKLLFHISDMKYIEQYCMDMIDPLIHYDHMNHTNLVSTLDAYMKHNGSLQETAEELYVHRNTVNYKIKKIESILDIKLSDFHHRTELECALLAYKLLSIQKNKKVSGYVLGVQ